MEITYFVDPSSTVAAFTHARLGTYVLAPTTGVKGDVRLDTTAGASRAWSPPV